MLRRLLPLLILISLSACAPAATATPAPTTAAPPTATLTATPIPDTPTPAPTETPAPTATATPVPELFQVSDKLDGLRAIAEWDSFYRDPGAIVYHDGLFHMFYNGINGFPRPVGVGYATSVDGDEWKIQTKQPVFNLGPLDHAGLYNGRNLFVTSALVEDDGTWVLYFYNIAGNSFESRLTIGRATATDPLGPWTPDPEPVLQPGNSGEWDARQVSSATVIKTESGYVMYYDGMGRSSMIGLATSPDGKTWTKYDDPTTTTAPFAESDPVLIPTEGSWDARRVMDPNVVQTETGWAMIYLTANGTQKFNGTDYHFGLATSPDGISWTKVGDEPALSNLNHPQWKGIYLSTLVVHDNVWRLYFDTARGANGQTVITLATFEGELGP